MNNFKEEVDSTHVNISMEKGGEMLLSVEPVVVVKREVNLEEPNNGESEPMLDWSSTFEEATHLLLEDPTDIKVEIDCDSSKDKSCATTEENNSLLTPSGKRKRKQQRCVGSAASDSSFDPADEEDRISTSDEDYEKDEKGEKIRNVLCKSQKVCKPDEFPAKSSYGLVDGQSFFEERGGTLYFQNMRIVKDKKGKFQCPFPCDQTLANKKSLKRHITRFHLDLTDAYSCDHCEEKFYFRFQLARHVQEKHGGGYRCDTCGKTLSTLCTLSRHKRLKHLGLRPHVCLQCGKSFGMKKNLTYHMKQHTKEES